MGGPPFWQTLMMRALSISVVLTALVLYSEAKPLFTVTPTINLGTPIVVNYKFTDDIDGRFMTVTGNGASGTGKFLSRKGHDWIGLYKAGDCANSPNNQMRHKCWVHWEYVPRDKSEGTVQFEAAQYKTSGTYDVRYFYGEDPTMPGAYEWMGQGYVCNTWLDNGNYVGSSGFQGNPSLTNVQLAQCQCDPSQASQVITLADGTTQTLTKEQCVMYRAACGRCALDAAGTSPVITVAGTGGVTTYQDQKDLPGFEIAF